jgi:small subunit ribosomal protein S17
MAEREQPRSRTREGVVVSSAMDKTIVVSVSRRVRYPRYRKTITLNKKFLAHDENNSCSVGDRVLICESRPMSKRKRWRLRSILERAQKDIALAGEVVALAVSEESSS